MLPTAATRRKSAPENGWMLLPKMYVYMGVVIIFVVGVLFGSGYHQANVGHALSQQQQYSITKPTVLVTGGLGFIGSHVVEDLLANGFHVVVYDDMSNGRNFNRGAAAVLVKDITVVNDYSFIVHKVDYIVHLAAAISVEESTRLPEKYERINVEGSRKVLDWAVKNGVKRVVAASSGATYGIPLPENLPLREETATGGICAYATTKFKMEGLMKDFNRDFGLPSTALRFFNVYGPRQDPHSSYSGVVSWFMEQAKINGTLKVSGEGDQYRDFVFVKDVARAIRTAMLLNDKEFDVFNVCTGIKTTVKEVAEKIVETFGSSAAIKNVPWRNGDVKESVCSLTKSRDKLGFTAGYSFSEGIAETRDWFMENQPRRTPGRLTNKKTKSVKAMASKYAKPLQVPTEFPDLLRSFTREALRLQGKMETKEAIYEFGAQYFRDLVVKRDGAGTKAANAAAAQGIVPAPQRQARLEIFAKKVTDVFLHGMMQDEVESLLREIFQRADADEKGALPRLEFMDALLDADLGFTRREVNLLMSEAPSAENNSGEILYQDFIPLCFPVLRDVFIQGVVELPNDQDSLAQYLVEVFASGDSEATGLLTVAELTRLFRAADVGLTRLQIITVMREAQEDKSGFVNYEKFAAHVAGMVLVLVNFDSQQTFAAYLQKYRKTSEYYAILDMNQHTFEQSLSRALEALDEGHRGILPREEVVSAIQNTFPDVSQRQLRSLMALADVDEMGELEYNLTTHSAFQALQKLQEYDMMVIES